MDSGPHGGSLIDMQMLPDYDMRDYDYYSYLGRTITETRSYN